MQAENDPILEQGSNTTRQQLMVALAIVANGCRLSKYIQIQRHSLKVQHKEKRYVFVLFDVRCEVQRFIFFTLFAIVWFSNSKLNT
jgi:hypothetical protein